MNNDQQQPPDRRPRPLEETSLYSLLRQGRQAANVPAVPVNPPARLVLPQRPPNAADRRSPVERREDLVQAIDNVLVASGEDLIPAGLVVRGDHPQEPPPAMQEETSVSNEDSTTSLVHEAAVIHTSDQLPSRASHQPRGN